MVMFPTEQAHLPIKGWTLRPPCAGLGIARGAASAEKIEKPSTFVQLSPIKGPSKGIIPLTHAGKRGLTPTHRPMPQKSIFGP